MVQNQLIAIHIALLCPFLSRRVDVMRYLESHVNFVMLLGLYYERCLPSSEGNSSHDALIRREI